MAPPGRALSALAYLTTGVVLNVVAQLVTDTNFAAKSTHLIPWLKFTATLLYAGTARLRSGAPPAPTQQQRRLMALIGVLDTGAYTAYCLGFYACGATLSNLLLSGMGQLLTALATRFVLGRRLAWGQAAGIACVVLGLAVRTTGGSVLSSSSGGGGTGAAAKAAAAALEKEQLVGGALIALAALGYSALGVAYDKLLKATGKPPPHAEIMWNTSKLGFMATTAYQLLYTLPRWDALVGQRMAENGVTPAYILPLLALFGALFNVHMGAQALMFRADGAVGVGLVNAARGAVITVLMGLLFCSPAKPVLCLTPRSALAAGITTLGGVIYVLSGLQSAKPPAAKAKAA